MHAVAAVARDVICVGELAHVKIGGMLCTASLALNAPVPMWGQTCSQYAHEGTSKIARELHSGPSLLTSGVRLDQDLSGFTNAGQ